MSKDIRRRTIGDNQNPIQDQAIRLIKEIHENVLDVQKHASEAWIGKNKTVRDNNALMSVVKTNKMIQRFQSWFKVVDAKSNGVDVHSAPIKTHKLNIVADRHNELAQYLVDKAAWEVLNGKK